MPKKVNYKYVDLKYVDLLGKLRHVTFPAERLTLAQTVGIGFDSSSLRGFKKTQKSDMVLILRKDAQGFLDPFFSQPTISFFADIYYNDRKTRYERDPRYILEKAVEKLKASLKVNNILFLAELEFYVFTNFEIAYDETQCMYRFTSDEKEAKLFSAYHATAPIDLYADHRNELSELLKSCQIDVKYHHHEGGELGQMEIETIFTDALKTADNITLAKYLIRNYFRRQNKYVTFMPKPFKNRAGSGMHVHHLIEKAGRSIFKGVGNELSEFGKHYVAGILAHIPAISAFANPTTNSYKRLSGGFETPEDATVGVSDRTSAIRIPGYAQARMPIEYRVGDATANPYLALAAIILAGLDGVNKKGKLKPSYVPSSLKESITELKTDHEFLTADGIFPKELIDFWIEFKTKEIKDIEGTPHPLEFIYYFEL
ncbi:MAG: glutamine synthetase beta-grasp domain-containing protein [candidate division WOR-3 bacterium]|nr:glutamine synthetase beta-grasp domain-containing protein [candidate division WOR-3 bacterium]MDW7987635.1 glutamine synthetase beta-grasp domain-containing protein [candidate division WOR-3 bacterium]